MDIVVCEEKLMVSQTYEGGIGKAPFHEAHGTQVVAHAAW